MAKPTLIDLTRLVSDVVFPFYQTDRDIPLRFDKDRLENDAEHSWSLALVACSLAPLIDKTLDVGIVAQFAIVHDLAELYAGDTSNFAPARKLASKEERERAAIARLTREMQVFPWLSQALHAYESQETEEARFVRSVDKTIPLIMDLLESGMFYRERKITLEHWQQIMQKHRQKASVHAGAFKYYEQIWDTLVAHPDFFYQPHENSITE